MLCSCDVSSALTLVRAINLAAKLRKVAASSQTSAIGAHALDVGCNVGKSLRSQVGWQIRLPKVAVCRASGITRVAEPVVR